MRSDFKPVHLRKANRELDAHELSSPRYQEQNYTYRDESAKVSLWEKFVRLFKTKPSELPEDLYK
ncbi:MAG TPA: hypothetical protein VLL31_00295 [Sulfurovum sp.]|nr:hypothetical protein [Sulfurovum sp.]